jgi:DNA-binding response OmpR family regulator
VRILVVDDEQLLAETLAQVLVRDAHAVDVCFDGAEALDRLSYNAYDVVISTGSPCTVQVCRSMSSVRGAAVLMLTGRLGGGS